LFAKITPPLVRFSGPAGRELTQQVEIVPEEKYPFKIVDSKALDGKHIRFKVKETTLSDQAGYVVNIENTKTDAGAYQDKIVLQTDSKIQPELTIKVYGNIYDLSLIDEKEPG